ncbi:DNA-binding CsgD family transcriptional regulator [Chryseobacterium sp. H1D6B]|uniref:LuxR C-terminal-related transcriptional regulator n=1 Tax=Chryseobacterium sp. H1D6B TaxID=2940588 RepID=UPI0015C94B42|nr:LuxR C-terminal-related transcriptional regulator [Chryseobacterium sp. H1D6B]MDH6252673.1 DNA-binding CsgD family transcriptional regulator [Chryseobacterium sp. H1D6B]
MFNTEINFSTFLYILIFVLLIIVVSVQLLLVWKRRDRKFYLKFLGLIYSGLLYNFVEGLLPDKSLGVNIMSQNIFAWIVGVGVAFHYFTFIKKEHGLNFIKEFSLSIIAIFALLTLLILFILPYTITGSLSYSRIYFLTFILALLSLAIILVAKQQIKKMKKHKNIIFKIHDIVGILSFLGLISLPLTILIFGDNQFIEQTFFSLGFFMISVNYFLYPLRKKEIKKSIPFEKLSVRETEILMMLLGNPNLKYSELSKTLNISEKTLSTHLSNIYKKIEIKSKKEIQEMSKMYKDSLIT